MAEKFYQESLRVASRSDNRSLSPNVRIKSIQIKEILDIGISHSITVRFHKFLNFIKHLADEIETLDG